MPTSASPASRKLEQRTDPVRRCVFMALHYWTTCPRISPLGNFSVWMLTYHFPANRSVVCSGVRLAVPLLSLLLISSTGPAFFPGAAGPWKCAPIRSLDKSWYEMTHISSLDVVSSLINAFPVAELSAGGTS